MQRRVTWLLAAGACLATVLQAAGNPFVGKWKLNPAKSKLTGQSDSVQSVGPNAYKFTYGAFSWTLTANGKDQPWPLGGSVILTAVAASTWKFTYQFNGRVASIDHWWLSPDGKSMIRAREGTGEDGSAFSSETRYRRTAGEKDFAGTWRSSKITAHTPDLVIILANGDDGITRSIPVEGSTVSLKFDGADYKVQGPRAPAGMTLAAERKGSRKIRTETKLDGKSLNTADISVSPDGRTTTVLQHDAGVLEPYIVIYDRQ
ncbi:MAG: hypothetical protein ABSH50_04795 [Bryobacteraceae bacterium]